jgi:hypothetical protein
MKQILRYTPYVGDPYDIWDSYTKTRLGTTIIAPCERFRICLLTHKIDLPVYKAARMDVSWRFSLGASQNTNICQHAQHENKTIPNTRNSCEVVSKNLLESYSWNPTGADN